jgi:hypothetical protein
MTMTSTNRPAVTVVLQPHTHGGHLDLVTRERISGWAMGANPSEPVALQILDNGRPIARVLSNMYRPDLEATGHGNGRYGFDIAIPGGLSPLTRHVIQVRREADGADLVGSPRMIEASDAFDAGLEQASGARARIGVPGGAIGRPAAATGGRGERPAGAGGASAPCAPHGAAGSGAGGAGAPSAGDR